MALESRGQSPLLPILAQKSTIPHGRRVRPRGTRDPTLAAVAGRPRGESVCRGDLEQVPFRVGEGSIPKIRSADGTI